ncbi:hypothetical protein OSB04_003386 [Centaurea solstitialis]|uniref:Uncharacterized protein n=1 Tax=Centaurea solstitialis TaxID=347529 RepID=A0AA38TUR5_9ASTR|nr:hypothetical protein OSB04_003386 [Centaurea solstitialis]
MSQECPHNGHWQSVWPAHIHKSNCFFLVNNAGDFDGGFADLGAVLVVVGHGDGDGDLMNPMTFLQFNSWSPILVLALFFPQGNGGLSCYFSSIFRHKSSKIRGETVTTTRLEKSGENNRTEEEETWTQGVLRYTTGLSLVWCLTPSSPQGKRVVGNFQIFDFLKNAKLPIRIYLNYDAVGHSPDRDCRNVGDIVKASLIK